MRGGASLAPGGVQRGNRGAGGGAESPVTRLARITGGVFVKDFGFVKGLWCGSAINLS